MDVMTEQVYYVEEHEYDIVEHIMTTYFIELQIFMIKDETSGKYLCFMTDYIHYFTDAREIMEYGNFQSLYKARFMFPQYNLNEENYGF